MLSVPSRRYFPPKGGPPSSLIGPTKAPAPPHPRGGLFTSEILYYVKYHEQGCFMPSKGLYANIHAKRSRIKSASKMAKRKK